MTRWGSRSYGDLVKVITSAMIARVKRAAVYSGPNSAFRCGVQHFQHIGMLVTEKCFLGNSGESKGKLIVFIMSIIIIIII